MVSDVICPCHGPLKLEEDVYAREIIHPGTGTHYDGWWTCENLLDQMKYKIIPAFNRMHPGKKAVFVFDNSLNHKKAPPNGLNADLLPRKNGGKNVPNNIRPGWFIDDKGDRVTQTMQTEEGVSKGIDQILLERGITPGANIRKVCKDRKICMKAAPYGCCLVNILSNQPDFQEQRSMLQELVEDSNHLFILLPKFHCEFNPIEMYWGDAKRYARNNCDYTWTNLRKIVPEALNQVGISKIRKYFRRCFRYMDAYRKGLPSHLVEYAVRKYKSHRSIPNSTTVAALEKEWEKRKTLNI